VRRNPKFYAEDPGDGTLVGVRAVAEQVFEGGDPRGAKLLGTVPWILRGDGRLLKLEPGSSGRGGLAVFFPVERRIVINTYSRAPLKSPTTVHWLMELAKVPSLGDWRLYRHADWEEWSGPGEKVIDLGMTVGDIPELVEEVAETTPVFDEEEPRSYAYHRAIDPRAVKWYHATLERHVPSILERGLLPSQVGGDEARPGWSPGWNMYLQEAVYLFDSLEPAEAVAETLAARHEEPVVVLEVDGRGLSDPSRLVVDEDVLYDDYGFRGSSGADHDFPEYQTSWNTGRGSIGYAGIIAPEHIRVRSRGEIDWDEEEILFEDLDDAEADVG